jgi:signal peptidase I
MDPIFDKGSNAIQIEPQSPSDVEVGDIITYRDGNRLIIHRVIDKGIDGQGWYWRVQGDNNPSADPVTLRFDDITRVVVAIVY